MAYRAFAAGLEFISEDGVARPKTAKTAPRGPSNEELDAIALPDYGLVSPKSHEDPITVPGPHTPSEARTPALDRSPTPKTPNELERSQPPTPKRDEARAIVPSWSYPRMNKWRVLSACLEYLGNGMNDSAPGALIPYIESEYRIGYAIVSLIWITNAVGFLLCAFSTDFISGRLGRAKTLMLSEALMIVAYTIIACPVPFPAIVAAYLVLGFGGALNLALNNVFVSNLANSTVLLGATHGSYGIGGVIGPLVATALVANGILWHRFYLITIGIRILCVLSTGWSFWKYESEETTRFNQNLERLASQRTATELGETSKLRAIGRALKNRATLIGALFIFAYQGAEVSESGWFISYLIDYRNGDPAHVGYVTSGFWGGITVGRFVLTHFARRIGEIRFVFGLGVGVIVLQLLAWLVPNVIGDSVAVAILGLLLGPVYPCAASVFTRLLPSSIQVFSIAFISSAGSSGGAVVPFLTGLIAQSSGTFVLHPICIGFYVMMLGCWAALPRTPKRTE